VVGFVLLIFLKNNFKKKKRKNFEKAGKFMIFHNFS